MDLQEVESGSPEAMISLETVRADRRISAAGPLDAGWAGLAKAEGPESANGAAQALQTGLVRASSELAGGAYVLHGPWASRGIHSTPRRATWEGPAKAHARRSDCAPSRSSSA